jgi:hypothetical protein
LVCIEKIPERGFFLFQTHQATASMLLKCTRFCSDICLSYWQ